MDDLTRIRKKIRKDKRFKSIKSIYKTNPLFQVTIDEYRDEIRTMFKIRIFRSLNTKSPNILNKLAEALVQDQSFRSRMTEILSQLVMAKKSLNDMAERFFDYASTEYARDLKAIGAAKERSSFVRDVLSEYFTYCENLDNLMMEIDIYVKDIDKAGYTAKNLIEVVDMLTYREGGIPQPSRKRR